MDYTTCCCLNPRCVLFGKVGSAARLKRYDWQRAGPRFQCQACRVVISASTGTAYAGVRTDLNIYRRGAKALAEGVSIRATGRLIEVDKDTVQRWLPILGQHGQAVMSYFFRNLHLTECQLDELWTFIYKKEAHLTPLEQLAEVYGDAWVWIAFSPVCKLVPAWVIGKRTLAHARRLVFRLKSATDGQIPFFTSDELPHYADALLEVYGQWVQPARHGARGRFPKPRRIPPPDLCYAVVVKERENGRVVEVTTRIVYGSTEQVEAALQASPVSRIINTYGVERNNLTVRQHSRRMSRKVNAFSKDPDYLEHQLTLAFAYYHFVVPHRGLRQRLPRALPTKGRTGSYKKWKLVTPAMAAGLTDHVWTMDELLSFRVPPKSLW
ncbi:MAG: helix-turn-helix domain-containing protein [Anaerolineales bacterium]|nr:helix-turn-helix domain-containing protein [Anaerolineales bacterium]